MNVTTIYAVAAASLATGLCLYCLTNFGLRILLRYGLNRILKHFFYAVPWTRTAGSFDMTRSHCAIALLYLAANMLCLFLGVQDRNQFSSRSGILSVVNMTPLLVGGRPNIIMNFLRVKLPQHGNFHHWVGRLCTVQGLIHGVYHLVKQNQETKIGDKEIILLVVTGVMIISSIVFVRRLFYEIFLKLHLLLSFTLLSALWLHLGRRKSLSTLCLLIGCSIWLFSFICQTIFQLYLNFGAGPCCSVSVSQTNGTQSTALLVRVHLRRPRKIQAGQYIYLSVPSISYLDWLQSHPYCIVWWEKCDKGVELTLLISPKRGFSKRLEIASSGARAIVNGPYGISQPLGEYDKVLLISSGIGIASHVSYILQLLKLHNAIKARVRRLSILWFVEDASYDKLIEPYMNQLLKLDERRILRFYLVPKSNLLKSERQGQRLNPLLKIKLKEIIAGENDAEAGKMVVSVCAPPYLQGKVCDAITANPQEIRLVITDFQPDETLSSKLLAQQCLEDSS